MDNIINKKQSINISRSRFCRIFPVLLLSFSLIFTAAGMKLFNGSGYMEDLLFYKRYEGMPSISSFDGFIGHMTAVLTCAAPALVQIFGIYLSSFSPFLVPLSILTVSARGFITGAAVSIAGGSHDFIQIGLYAVVTMSFCVMSAFFLRTKKITPGNVLQKTFSFLSVSGLCVLGESIISFIL